MNQKTKDTRKLCEFLEGIRKRCPDHSAVLEALGDLYTKMGRVDDGLEIDELLTSRDPQNETYWYNLACSHSLLGNVEAALSALKQSVELGYCDSGWIQQDRDLDNIRALPEFDVLIKQIDAGSDTNR